MAKALDVTKEFALINEELASIKDFNDWAPPPGNYEVILIKLHQGETEQDGTLWPWYKLSFKLVDTQDLPEDEFSRIFSLKPTKGRKWQLSELQRIAGCVNGKPVDKFEDVLEVVTKAADAGETVLNVSVKHERARDGRVNDDGTPTVYTRYNWSPAA